MAFFRERLAQRVRSVFPWLWRLAILSLPWQTRLFHEAPLVAGYPWEQGRSSVYVSWFLMLAVIVAALFLDEGVIFSKREEKRRRSLSINMGWLMLVIFTGLATPVPRATLQWWMEVILLYAFFHVLWERVAWREAVQWFVISMIPQMLLGVWQAFSQVVVGSKWLGIATQIPATPGVAVIEAGGTRWLRSYGGFPHPNIFGGWLMAALLVIQLRLMDLLLAKRERIFYYLSLAVCSVGLALTYSRSAWIGLGMGCVVLAGVTWRSSVSLGLKRRSWLALGLILLSAGSVFVLRSSLILSRAQSTARLEQKSVNERLVGFQNVQRVVRAHPWVGAGLGGGAWAIAELDTQQGRAATIPLLPHAVPFIALMELGLFGGCLLVLSVSTTVTVSRRFWKSMSKATRWHALILTTSFVSPFFLDHYLWSYWSGKTLFALIVFFAISVQKDQEPAQKIRT